MDRPYGTYSSTSTTTRNAGASGARRGGRYRDVETEYPDHDVQDYDSYDALQEDASDDSYDEHYDDSYDDVYAYEDPIDRRWIWVAGVAGAILLVAVICTVVILGGGDSGAVSKTVAPPAPTTAQRAATPTAAPPVLSSVAPPPPPVAPLSPETVTTVAPSPSATVAPAPAAAAPPDVPPASPRTITYQVTGSRPLLDMVTIVYTDAQGALQTDFNVALPWARTVTLDPGVELKSVIATSLTGQLNCQVTDATGLVLVAQNNNAMIATCTR